ncbi:hypothetical protein EON65_57315, partial [archaeon]
MLRSPAATFEHLGDLPTACWKAVASDSSGQYMVAASSLFCPTVAISHKHKQKNITSWPSAGSIYVSSNSGKHWVQATLESDKRDFVSISISAKGQYIVATALNSPIVYSMNYGVSWSVSSSTSSIAYASVTSSNSGLKVIATAPLTNPIVSCENFNTLSSGLWVSMDYGQSFVRDSMAPKVSWRSVSCDRDCGVRVG